MQQSLKVKKMFEGARKIALFGHTNPDGDCIGSMLGLGGLLEKQGKSVKYFVPTSPGSIFNFLVGIKKIKTHFDYKKYDLIVFLDFSGYGRIEKFSKGNEKYFNMRDMIVIDHHLGDEPLHASCIKDIDCMSTCELLFEQTKKRRPELLDGQIASYFYLGLTTDSGNFLYDVDHERILSNALALVRLGADKGQIVNHMIRKKSLNSVKFMELLLSRMKQRGDLLYSYYSAHELDTYHLDQEEAGDALRIMQNINGPKLVLMLSATDHQLKGSLRSRALEGKGSWTANIDSNEIARRYGGGGHMFAAGFSCPLAGSLHQQIDKITDEISTMIV